MGKAWTRHESSVLGLADDHLPARPGQRTSTKPPCLIQHGTAAIIAICGCPSNIIQLSQYSICTAVLMCPIVSSGLEDVGSIANVHGLRPSNARSFDYVFDWGPPGGRGYGFPSCVPDHA